MIDSQLSLDEIGVSEGTDKSSLCHNYLDYYEKILQNFRNKTFSLLEIGVYNGASLRTWRRYFSRAKIVGIDINPECMRHATEGIDIRIGSQIDPNFLSDISSEIGFTVVIDDGSHRADHIPFTLGHLYPKMMPGGCYIVEDLEAHTGAQAYIYRGEAIAPPIGALGEVFKEVATKMRHDVERVEALPGAVALWKPSSIAGSSRVEHIEKVLNSVGSTAESWYYFSTMMRDRGDFEKSREYINKAVKLGGKLRKYQELIEDIKTR